MYNIFHKKILNPDVFELKIKAPLIAAKAKAGQFCILVSHDKGERVPFTLADWNKEEGSITLVIQVLGKTSAYLMNEDLKAVAHASGPLGEPSVIEENHQKVIFTAGGLGVAAVYPIMKSYFEKGIKVKAIIGFRNKDLVFWEDELKKVSHELIITTDDGSYGEKGRVTDPLLKCLEEKESSLIYSIGPLVMMKAVSDLTKKYSVKTYVSLNPVMVDGIGMCGACRVTVNGETRYACIEGPEFEAHDVDFNELILRSKQFKAEEDKCFRDYLRGKKS